jgi:hypothetical protein
MPIEYQIHDSILKRYMKFSYAIKSALASTSAVTELFCMSPAERSKTIKPLIAFQNPSPLMPSVHEVETLEAGKWNLRI